MHAKGSRHIFRSLTFSHALHGKYTHLFKSVMRKASSISLHSGRNPDIVKVHFLSPIFLTDE